MATPSDPLSQAILEAVNRVGHRPRPIPPDLAARLLADDGRAVPVTWRRFDYDDDGMPAGVHVEDFTATVAVTRESLGLPPEDGDEA